DIVRFPRGNTDKCGNIAPQVQQRVQFDGRLVPAKRRPGKQLQAQVDRRGVERIGRLIQVHAESVVGVQTPSPCNQHLGEVRVDAPIASTVGVSQRAAGDASAKTGVVELRLYRTQTSLDVAQALAKREL